MLIGQQSINELLDWLHLYPGNYLSRPNHNTSRVMNNIWGGAAASSRHRGSCTYNFVNTSTRYCANQEVAGFIPDDIIGHFNLSDRPALWLSGLRQYALVLDARWFESPWGRNVLMDFDQ